MAPGGLVEVCISWPGHPRYLKKKKTLIVSLIFIQTNQTIEFNLVIETL